MAFEGLYQEWASIPGVCAETASVATLSVALHDMQSDDEITSSWRRYLIILYNNQILHDLKLFNMNIKISGVIFCYVIKYV